MNYMKIKKRDISNGPGVRVSLYVSGCRHHCKNCFNPETWSFEAGELYDESVTEQIIEELKPSYVKGISLLGGDPFEPENQAELVKLLRRVRSEVPEKTVWCYTGYDYEKDILTGKLSKENRGQALKDSSAAILDKEFVMCSGEGFGSNSDGCFVANFDEGLMASSGEGLMTSSGEGLSASSSEELMASSSEELMASSGEGLSASSDEGFAAGSEYESASCSEDTAMELLSLIDVLVDGEFAEELKVVDLRFRGSTNQRIIDVKKSLETDDVVLWHDEEQQIYDSIKV